METVMLSSAQMVPGVTHVGFFWKWL